MNFKLEYIWLDGYKPEPNLRSKVKVLYNTCIGCIKDVPEWNFDGSSTQQAEGSKSDCILKPVRLYRKHSSNETQHIYVLCEVMNPDGTPHESNHRSRLGEEDNGLWFGFEQEFFIKKGRGSGKRVLGIDEAYLEPQGKYYCGVGSYAFGRHFIEEHLDLCIGLGLKITGTNAEVAIGQWEYQVFSQGKLKAGDDLWMARYLMEKLSEKYGYYIEYHPKPLNESDWNGSGLHTNFSNERMRDYGDKDYFNYLFKALEQRVIEHMNVYGSDNHLRLTGKHETQAIDKFSVGVSDRGASIRIPIDTAKNWRGYLEDRRPASNANPYEIIRVIDEAINLAEYFGSDEVAY